MLGARTRQTTRRSKRSGVGEAREEEEEGEVLVARPRRARSSPRWDSAKEEEVQSAPPSSGLYSRCEEKEGLSTQSRRSRSTGRRSAPGEDGEVRGSRPGRPERSIGHSAKLDQEDVLATRNTLGQNAPREDEAVGCRTRSSGARQSLRKCTGEEEEVWGTRLLRPKHGASGDAKVQSATPVSAKSSTEKSAWRESEAAPEPGTRSRRASSGTSGHVKVRKEEKRALGTRSWRRVASVPVKYAVQGEDEDAPRTRDVTGPTDAGDEMRARTSGHLGEEEMVPRSPRPAPIPSRDAGNYALDTDDQRAIPGISGREETPPAASCRKESGEEERREEDEDCNLVRQLLRLKDQIKQQLLEYKTEVEASKESPIEELTEGDLLQRIDDLERKMEGVKIEIETKTLALKRIQVAHALQKKLGKKDSESESILAILKNILTLNSSILKAQQKTRDLEEKIREVKKKRLILKKAGEEKLLEIQAENKKKKDELNLLKNSALLTKMKKSLQNEIDTTTIIQNVFQHIVMAAKIDWAADPALKVFILQLEKNLSLI